MAKRQIRDDRGVRWDVWDVWPDNVPNSRIYDRRKERRVDPAERALSDRALLDPELEQGWLCFQSGDDRRRFAPIPPQWFELPDGVLRVMVDIATPVVVSALVGSPRSTAK